MNLVQTYALPDQKESRGGAIRINRGDAAEWNAKGYGIFQTVNQFWLKRKISHLVCVNAWIVDIDGGDKEAAWAKLKTGLVPTMIVETKNGYHAYWKAKDGTVENWKSIVENRLIPFYDSDKKAKDLARLLRVPGFYHLKDPANPFLVQKVHYEHVEYSEREMFSFYRDIETPKKQRRLHNAMKKESNLSGDFWDRVWSIDCAYALEKLSGSEAVKGELFDFKENASGTFNILVNGKSTSCWIDRDKRIGSFDKGGPTIAAWLHWYGHPWPKVVEILKQNFPELMNENLSEQMSLVV